MPRRFLLMLPQTRRQWVGFGLFTMAVALAVWQGTVFTYNAKLRAIEEREWRFWSTLARESESGVVVVEADTGKIIGWNSGAEVLLGWTATEVVGSTWAFLVPQEYIADKYTHLGGYIEKATSPEVADRLFGTVKIINGGMVNTRSGRRVPCRISVRTVGSRALFYVVQMDPEQRVQEIMPDVDVPVLPGGPDVVPTPGPMPPMELR